VANYSEQDKVFASENNPKVASIRGAQVSQDTGSLHLDMLEYLADMLVEMRALAERTQCETLTGMIALAAREAELRRRNL
jgi:hypothetical protein